jgi:hypothetical protein
VVVGGSWQEKDALKDENVMNQDEETFNTTFWDPGIDAQCDLVTKVTGGSPAPYKSQVITESGGAARTWLIMDADTKGFGKRALKYSVKLQQRDAQDLTLIS